MENNRDCIFCKIIEGKIPCNKVYENKDVLAFLDMSPVNRGHVLIVPKKHSETLLDTDEQVLCKIIKATKKISNGVMKAVNANGINIIVNNFKAAGQIVPHMHMHIVPRFSSDGFTYTEPKKKFSESEMQKVAENIRKAL